MPSPITSARSAARLSLLAASARPHARASSAARPGGRGWTGSDRLDSSAIGGTAQARSSALALAQRAQAVGEGLGFLRATDLLEQDPQVVERGLVVGIDLQRPAVHGERVGDAARARQAQAEIDEELRAR